MTHMTTVESSNIHSIGYEESLLHLDIVFQNGDWYRYFEVPKGIYEKLMTASSKGQFFDKFVKKAGYKFEKLETRDFTRVRATELSKDDLIKKLQYFANNYSDQTSQESLFAAALVLLLKLDNS